MIAGSRYFGDRNAGMSLSQDCVLFPFYRYFCDCIRSCSCCCWESSLSSEVSSFSLICLHAFSSYSWCCLALDWCSQECLGYCPESKENLPLLKLIVFINYLFLWSRDVLPLDVSFLWKFHSSHQILAARLHLLFPPSIRSLKSLFLKYLEVQCSSDGGRGLTVHWSYSHYYYRSVWQFL